MAGRKGQKGHSAWNKDKIGWMKHTEEQLTKMSKHNIGKHNRKRTETEKIRISETMKSQNRKYPGRCLTEEIKNKIRASMTGKKQSKITKQKRSEKIAIVWQDPNIREKQIKAILKGSRKRPSSLEKSMLEIINKYQLPLKYTGNGSFLVGSKNPDFIDINGKQLCVEVGNNFHHNSNYANERKAYFAKYNWRCAVFIGDVLVENDVLNSLKDLYYNAGSI